MYGSAEMARRVWEILLALLGIALAIWISESIPHATLARDIGAAVVVLIVALLLVVLWDNFDLTVTRKKPVGAPKALEAPQLTAPQPISRPTPAPAPRVFSSMTIAALKALAADTNLTNAERQRLAEPHQNHWLRIEGTVYEVNGAATEYTVQVLVTVAEGGWVIAYFSKDKERVASLRKGTAIRLIGRINRVEPLGVSFVDCEFDE